MRIGVITARGGSSEQGGAERFYEALVGAFNAIGHTATELPVMIDEPNFSRIRSNYLTCYDLDVRHFDMVVSTKAPTWMVRHPRHVCYLVHTIRVFYDMFASVFPQPWDEVLQQQKLVHQLDSAALAKPHCKAVYTIGKEVSKRLEAWNGISSPILHPPLWANNFSRGRSGNYFFHAGRLHPWKRVDLLIKAFKATTGSVQLLIAGTGEAEADLKSLAMDDSRISFLGRVSDAELINLYANAIAVPFTPLREDYGYVTLEAFASGKPVITCTDSGEAACIVAESGGGVVVEPTIDELRNALAEFSMNRESTEEMGSRGYAWVQRMSWSRVAQTLIDAAWS